MKKSKVVFGLSVITVAVFLVTGCGASQKAAVPPPASQEQAAGHQGHSASMPKEDPMPMMKDLDKNLQDVVKQVQAGQIMAAQKSAAQLVSVTDKVMPHMMDASLKDKLRTAALDIKDKVNAGKVDPAVIEDQAKAMQGLLQQTTAHLQTMSHN